MFYFPTDDSQEQTQSVMTARVERAKGQSRSADKAAIVRKHQAAQAILAENTNIEIVIPFADLIRLPTEDPHSRRLHDRILLLLEAVTFLGQFREGRPRDKRGDVVRVHADEIDWEIALPLIDVIVTQKYGLPDKGSKEFLEKLKPHGPGPFSIEDLREHVGMSDSTVRRRIRSLPPGCVGEGWDANKLVYTFKFDGSPCHAIGLPSVEEVRDYLRKPEKLAS